MNVHFQVKIVLVNLCTGEASRAPPAGQQKQLQQHAAILEPKQTLMDSYITKTQQHIEKSKISGLLSNK